MKPATLGLDEITPETLIRVDLEGNVVEGELPLHLEFLSYYHSRTGRGSRQHAGWKSRLLPDQPCIVVAGDTIDQAVAAAINIERASRI